MSLVTPEGQEIDNGTIHGRLSNRLRKMYPFMSEPDLAKLAHNMLAQYPSLEQQLAPPSGVAWTGIGAQVSAIPDVLYPPDPAVVRAIRREFDPYVVPVFVSKWYRSQSGGLRRCGHHAMAVANPDAQVAEPWTYFVMRPSSGPLLPITSMGMHFEERDTRPGNGLPGDMMPWDWKVYHIMRGWFLEATAAEKKQITEERGREAVARKAKEHADEELDHAAASPPKGHSLVGRTPQGAEA